MRFFIFLCLFVFLASCQNSKTDTVENQNRRAMTLIEKGQYDEAIEILTAEDARHPNDRSKILLASAYAKKADFEIEDYWGYTVGYKEFVKDVQVVGRRGLESIFGNQITPLVYMELEKQGLTAADLYQVLQRLDKVPEKTFEQVDLLVKARDVLAPSTSGGAHLYRAIIGIVVVKYSIQRIVEYIPKAAVAPSSECHGYWNSVGNWFAYALKSLDEVLVDLSFGFPSKVLEAQKASAQIADFLQQLPQKKSELMEQVCTLE